MTRIVVYEANQLYVTTRCRSVAQFVAVFERYVLDDALFVSTMSTRPVGVELPFVVTLADGTPVLRGEASVRDAWKTSENPFRLPGILLGVTKLTPRARTVFERMQQRHVIDASSASPPPPPIVEAVDEEALVEAATLPTRMHPDDEPQPFGRCGFSKQYFCPLPRSQRQLAAGTVFDDDSPVEAVDPFSASTRVNMVRPASDDALRPPTRKLVWRWIGIAIMSVAISVGVVRATTTDDVAPSSSAASTHALPSRDTATQDRPEVVPDVSAWSVAGTGPCQLAIAASPRGALVQLDGKPQGGTPLVVSTTCGEHRIDIAHPTHETRTVWGTLLHGTRETVDVSLARRIDTVTVTSRPAGAMIYISGQAVGRTPAQLEVLGNTPVKLELKKRGYRPVTEQLYTTKRTTKLSVLLRRAGK